MRSPLSHTHPYPILQIGVLYWTFDADTYKTDAKFAVRFGDVGVAASSSPFHSVVGFHLRAGRTNPLTYNTHA